MTVTVTVIVIVVVIVVVSMRSGFELEFPMRKRIRID